MKHRGCPYRAKLRGRSMTPRPGQSGSGYVATLTCSRCGGTGEFPCRSDATPHTLDLKFKHAGWLLDPHECPSCRAPQPKEKAVTSKPSQAAMKSQAQMFHALSAHFDPETGQYAAGWSDQKIATETGLAADVVVEFRKAGFGELKEAPAVAALRADIRTLEVLHREHNEAITKEIAVLRGRVSKLSGPAA